MTTIRLPRLLLRTLGASSGSIDGAWWPRTANPNSELHDLITVLRPRIGQLARVVFDWKSGECIDCGIMHLYGVHGVRLALLVIPADTAPALAARQMRWATGQPLPADLALDLIQM